jgi:eight-cysteine-cluster-containing protein
MKEKLFVLGIILAAALAGALTDSNILAPFLFSTDEQSYAPGEVITFTLTNRGSTAIDYNECTNGEIFADIYGPNGQALLLSDPRIRWFANPCTTKSLQAGQSASATWDQNYYDEVGTRLLASPGAYNAVFNGMRVDFIIRPASSGDGIRIWADEEFYTLGEQVAVTAYNGGSTVVSYMDCDGVFYSMRSNSMQLYITNPILGRPCQVKNLSPGQTISHTWNQQLYTRLGEQYPARSGQYSVHLESASDSFAILGAGEPTPPPGNNPYAIYFASGWNLFSVPLLPAVKLKDSTCAAASFWEYTNGAYRRVDASGLAGGKGYWFRASAGCSMTFEGSGVLTPALYHVGLVQGWNLIGAPSQSIDFYRISRNCGITSGPWRYDSRLSRYVASQALEPGVGYWVKATGACTLSLPLVEPSPVPTIFPTPIPTAIVLCNTSTDCVVDGCSGQVCRSRNSDSIITTCEWKAEYACYTASGCGCIGGQCQWSQATRQCVAGYAG